MTSHILLTFNYKTDSNGTYSDSNLHCFTIEFLNGGKLKERMKEIRMLYKSIPANCFTMPMFYKIFNVLDYKFARDCWCNLIDNSNII